MKGRALGTIALIACLPGGLAIAGCILLYRAYCARRYRRQCEAVIQELRDQGVHVMRVVKA